MSGDTHSISCRFGDLDAGNTHSCQIDWGDGAVTRGTVNQVEDTCRGSHRYEFASGPGRLSLILCVTDNVGARGCDIVRIVINHPTGCTLGPLALGGTNDFDCDNLSDNFEAFLRALFPATCLSPTDPDSDHDRLIDSAEVTRGTNVCLPDSDGDGIFDGWEVNMMLNQLPCLNPSRHDSDADGISDGGELFIRTGPCDPDSDNDGLIDGGEIFIAVLRRFLPACPQPLDPDSDDDGIRDGREVFVFHSNPCDAGSPGLASADALLWPTARAFGHRLLN